MDTNIPSILVTINCSDKAIEIELKKLLQYEYFEKMLNFGQTKIFHEKTIKVDEHYTEYNFKIPHINIDINNRFKRNPIKD